MTISIKDKKNIKKMIKHIMNIPLKLVQSDKVTEHLNEILYQKCEIWPFKTVYIYGNK